MMACREFQIEMIDVASGSLVDAAARQAVLAHVEECSVCAARLSAERALTQDFREIARADESAGAPPRVKAAAVAAFRAAAPEPVLRSKPRTFPFLAVAAALAVLTLPAGYAVWSAWRSAPAIPTHGPDVANVPPSRVETETTRPHAQPHADDTSEHVVLPPVGPNGNIRKIARRARSRTSPASVLAATETVTEYIPLTYLDDATAMESGQVVRIDVPRSSLAAFGLPVGQDRLDERVKADIVIGDDGLARAIRFVHEAQ